MNVLITGAAGFLGQRLTHALLQRGSLTGPDGRPARLDRVTLVDVVAPPALADSRVTAVVADVHDEARLASLVDRHTAAIFHLSAIVSGQAESDFDLGMRVNVDATRALLDLCRRLGHAPRFVFTSSVAVYGGSLPETVLDSTILTPQSSYGTQKAIAELLINDHSRRGFVDGRSLRLPTISVRPGRANAALSSFASGIIREPLNGDEAICPVAPDTVMWLLSPGRVIECLITAHELPAEALGSNRSIILPGLAVTVREMATALARVAGPEVASRIRWEPDARLQRIASTWPGRLDDSRARGLGFTADASFDDIIRQYQADHPSPLDRP